MPVHPRTDAANAPNGRVPLGFGNLFAWLYPSFPKGVST